MYFQGVNFICKSGVSFNCKSTSGEGNIKVNIKSISKGYEVSNDGGITWAGTFEKTYTFSNLNSGSYSIVARDWSYPDNISKVLVVSLN